MVLLTIVTNSNPHTLYFDHNVAKPNYIHLLSASMYNSWYNLAENGLMSVRLSHAGGNSQSLGSGSPTYVSITSGFAKTISDAFKEKKYKHCCRYTHLSWGYECFKPKK